MAIRPATAASLSGMHRHGQAGPEVLEGRALLNPSRESPHPAPLPPLSRGAALLLNGRSERGVLKDEAVAGVQEMAIFFIKDGILVSYRCCNKLPHASHNTNVFSYSTKGQKSEMGFTGLKSRCPWGYISGGSRKESTSVAFSSL